MSGARFTVEYTGWGGDNSDSDRPEPAFIRQFKQRAGLRPEPTLADKFADNAPSASSKNSKEVKDRRAKEDDEPEARNEEEMPQIVVTAESGGITEAELALVQSRMREAGEDARFEENRSRVRFVGRTVEAGKRKSAAAAEEFLVGRGVVAATVGAPEAAKRSKPSVGGVVAMSTSSSSASAVCDRKLLSFDDEEGDD